MKFGRENYAMIIMKSRKRQTTKEMEPKIKKESERLEKM